MTMPLGPDETPRVRRTLYPVRVDSSAGTAWDFAQVIITTDSAYVFVPGPAGAGIALAVDGPIVDEQLAPAWGGARSVSTVTLPTETLTITQLGGCGCASALKHHRPFDTRAVYTI